MGNIINFEDYRKHEEEIEDNDQFMEVDMDVTCLDDVVDVIHSSMPYNEKIEYLKNEREKALLLEEYISYSLDNILKSEKYLKVLNDDLEDIERRMKTDIPLTSLVGFLSAGSIYYLVNELFKLPNIDINNSPLFIFILASTLLTALFGYKLKHTIEDFKDKYSYEDAIREYKCILKRKLKKD